MAETCNRCGGDVMSMGSLISAAHRDKVHGFVEQGRDGRLAPLWRGLSIAAFAAELPCPTGDPRRPFEVREVIGRIDYAYELRDDELISLTMEGLRRCVRMRLRDHGKQAPRDSMKGRPHTPIKPGGLGLHLIRNAFDKVDYVLKKRGTELVLTKNLPATTKSRGARSSRTF